MSSCYVVVFMCPATQVDCASVERKGKGKTVPLQARRGPLGSRKLRFPDFMTMAQDGGKFGQPYAPGAFYPPNALGTHFC